MKNLQDFTVRLIAGGNIATIVCMLLIGFSDRINPVSHPLLANIGLFFPVFLSINVGFLFFWLIVRKRMAIIPVVGLVLGFVPVRTYTPLNMPEEAPKGSLKVMSYNVFNFSTWTSPDEPCPILDFVEKQRPDILCMQEFCSDGWKKDRILERLGKLYPNSRITDPKGGDPIAIFSRFPIIRTDTIHYESRANNSAAYHLLIPGGDTTIVVVNHFESTGLSKDDRRRFKAMLKGDIERKEAESESRNIWRKLAEASAIRAPQADSVAAYVERHEGKSIILTGDFNDSPISYVHHRLASVLTDCYVASANGPGISYHYNAFYVRIDNIMCSSHWEPYACRVDNGIKASDHYPIICSLERKKE